MSLEQRQYPRLPISKDALKSASSIDSLYGLLKIHVDAFLEGKQNDSIFENYLLISGVVPFHVPRSTEQPILEALRSRNPEVKKRGKYVLSILHSKSIINGLKPFLRDSGSEDDLLWNDELLLYAFEEVASYLSKTKENLPVTQMAHRKANQSAGVLTARHLGIPVQWVLQLNRYPHVDYLALIETTNEFLSLFPYGMSKQDLVNFANELVVRFKVTYKDAYHYLEIRNQSQPDDEIPQDPVSDLVLQNITNELIHSYIAKAFPDPKNSRRLCLLLAFGFTTNKKAYSTQEIGSMLGFTEQTVRNILLNAFSILRRPNRKERLKQLIDEK